METERFTHFFGELSAWTLVPHPHLATKGTESSGATTRTRRAALLCKVQSRLAEEHGAAADEDGNFEPFEDPQQVGAVDPDDDQDLPDADPPSYRATSKDRRSGNAPIRQGRTCSASVRTPSESERSAQDCAAFAKDAALQMSSAYVHTVRP